MQGQSVSAVNGARGLHGAASTARRAGRARYRSVCRSYTGVTLTTLTGPQRTSSVAVSGERLVSFFAFRASHRACCAGLRRFVRPRRVPVASSSRKLTLNLGSKLGVYIDTPPLYPNPIPHPVQWRFFLRQTLLAAAAAAGEHESAFHLRQVCRVHGRGCLKPTQ